MPTIWPSLINCRSTPVCPKCAFEVEDHDQKTCNNPPLCVNCKSSYPTYSKECSVWKDEKEILSMKFKDNVTFLEARKTVEKRRSDQALLSKSTTYANVVSLLTTNGNCPTCELLAKKLLQRNLNLNLHLHNLQLDLMFHLKNINLMIQTGQKKKRTNLNCNLEIPPNHVKSRSRKIILSLPPIDFWS